VISSTPTYFRSGRSCFEFRVGIEGEVAATAARNRTQDDLVRLTDALARLEDPTQGSLGIDEDFAFHVLVATASHNDYFVSALLQLKPEIYKGMLLARTPSEVNVAEKLAAINEQHRMVYTAVVAQNTDGARHAMRDHLIRCKRSTSQWYLQEAELP
jgi:GntR family transcriptional repressor for pyruvate dehydrogenase complex